MTLQQAHDIGLQKGIQQSYITGFVSAVLICGTLFIGYKGVCWMMAKPAPAAVARRAAVAAAAQQ